jgi:hypothetical protein
MLIDPRSPIRHYESDSIYTVGYSGANLRNYPRDQYGFPIWPGVWTKWGITHAYGAYQAQPAWWHYYAQLLGISEDTPANQDAMAAEAFRRRAFADWAPFDAKLAAYIVAQGGLSAFALGGSNPFP